MAFLILSQISVGVMLMLLWIPMPRLGRGFFSFHTGMALALELIAHALSPDTMRMATHGPYVAALLLLSILFAARKMRYTPAILRATATFGLFALAAGAYLGGGAPFGAATVAIVSSALVLGSVIVTMNLGHWYLVIRGLPFELLGAANLVCIGTLIARVIAIAVGWAMAPAAWATLGSNAGGPIWDTALFLTVRVLFGLVAPLILAWMIHECVKIKSNQSATGILYVSVVFILIGELSGAYFLLERGVPL